MDANSYFGRRGFIGVVLGALHTRREREKLSIQRANRVISQSIQVVLCGLVGHRIVYKEPVLNRYDSKVGLRSNQKFKFGASGSLVDKAGKSMKHQPYSRDSQRVRALAPSRDFLDMESAGAVLLASGAMKPKIQCQ